VDALRQSQRPRFERVVAIGAVVRCDDLRRLPLPIGQTGDIRAPTERTGQGRYPMTAWCINSHADVTRRARADRWTARKTWTDAEASVWIDGAAYVRSSSRLVGRTRYVVAAPRRHVRRRRRRAPPISGRLAWRSAVSYSGFRGRSLRARSSWAWSSPVRRSWADTCFSRVSMRASSLATRTASRSSGIVPLPPLDDREGRGAERVERGIEQSSVNRIGRFCQRDDDQPALLRARLPPPSPEMILEQSLRDVSRVSLIRTPPRE
jgi:hypothetical protein